MKMDKLQCTNCNAPIDPKTYICPYCGTKYMRPKSEIQPMFIEVERSGVHALQSRIVLDRGMIDMIGKENASKICVEKLTNEIAKSLTPFMEVYTDYDPARMAVMMTGRIRVVEPSYRF